MSYIYKLYITFITFMTFITFIKYKTFITVIILNVKVQIFPKCDVFLLVKYQKTLTKNERLSNILLVEVNGDACVEPHNKKGEARQDEQL